MFPNYIYDPTVTRDLDREIRELLGLCFSDETFRYQRFNYELPAHRWILRNAAGALVAQVAVHDKRLGTEAGEVRVAGVAEVCVHPDERGKGYMRLLLEQAHRWCREQGMLFSTLFGISEIYGTFGYLPKKNPLFFFNVNTGSWKQESFSRFQVLPLTAQEWPHGRIDLHGPKY